MFFDGNEEDEKRLLELLKFKRRAVFEDNEDISFELGSYSISNEK
jgi:hypothetical protein